MWIKRFLWIEWKRRLNYNYCYRRKISWFFFIKNNSLTLLYFRFRSMNIIEIYSETNIYMYIYLIIFLIKKKHDEMTKNKSYIIKKKHHNKIFFSCLETIDKTMFFMKKQLLFIFIFYFVQLLLSNEWFQLTVNFRVTFRVPKNIIEHQRATASYI